MIQTDQKSAMVMDADLHLDPQILNEYEIMDPHVDIVKIVTGHIWIIQKSNPNTIYRQLYLSLTWGPFRIFVGKARHILAWA